MHLCFIDESGTPPKAAKAKGYFVIAGVIMHEAQWRGVADELSKLRSRPEYKVRGEIKWRYFGSANTDADNSVRHLDQTHRDAFRTDFFNILTRRKSIKIVACVASCEAAYETTYVNSPEDLYKFTYKPVSERFQYYLQDVSRAVGDTQLGIIVADHRGKQQDDEMRKAHHGLVDTESMFSSSYSNYVETIFLTPSHLSVGIQFADMISGAIGRAYNANDPLFFDTLKPSFRTSPTGQIDGFGLVKFPKNGWK